MRLSPNGYGTGLLIRISAGSNPARRAKNCRYSSDGERCPEEAEVGGSRSSGGTRYFRKEVRVCAVAAPGAISILATAPQNNAKPAGGNFNKAYSFALKPDKYLQSAYNCAIVSLLKHA